jgi:hypothetical protein
VVFATYQRLVEFEQRGRLDESAKLRNPAPGHEQRRQAEDEAIGGGQIRRKLSAAITDQQLVLQQQRLCREGTYTTGADKLRERDQ